MIRLSIGCFFFKQKTAYEMRISDWSSDVCSSDLILDQRLGRARRWQRVNPVHHGTICRPRYVEVAADALDEYRDQYDHDAPPRSEEHTSELQSLMRISYAVLCLKKKKKYNNQ